MKINFTLYNHWVGVKVVKKSRKPFKSSLKVETVVEVTINPHSNKAGLLMDDGSVVNLCQCSFYQG